MTEFGAPFVGSIKRVEDQWIDYNGHFNMAYYGILFDRTLDEAFELVGLGARYVNETNCACFTLEAQFTYLRELAAGDAVKVTVQLLDHDATRVHYVQEMFHAREGWLSCVMEAICGHIDMSTRRSAPLCDDVRRKLAAMHAAHQSLPVPPQVGHRIASLGKVA